jgi:hypothetical protein
MMFGQSNLILRDNAFRNNPTPPIENLDANATGFSVPARNGFYVSNLATILIPSQ